jgi:hypothetical protein
MGLFSRFIGGIKLVDEPLEKQREDLLSNPMVIIGLWETEEGCDEILGSKGAFGITKSNPIPVNGVIGEVCYINRLRAKTGVGFFYHRLGSMINPINNKSIDQFELVAVDASEWFIIYLSPYYSRRSTKTPTGLTLLSWNGMNELQHIMCKMNVFGSTSFINNFPVDLANISLDNPELKNLAPDLGGIMAKKISDILSMHKGKWSRPYRIRNL